MFADVDVYETARLSMSKASRSANLLLTMPNILNER